MEYATVRSLDILIHKHATYGMLKDEDIQAIDISLKTPINGDTNSEYFVTQIEDN